MLTFEGIEENFRFLVIETENLVRSTLEFVKNPSSERYEKIVSRDDYIDNLKNTIENQCYARIHTDKLMPEEQINHLRGIQTICVNLERLADKCINIIKQLGYLENREFLDNFNYTTAFKQIKRSISRVFSTLENHDLSGALEICKVEPDLDKIYKAAFEQIMQQLKTGTETQNLITSLFIMRYLERMGDNMLNIGEGLILAIIGEKIKIHQFHALQETLTKSGFSGNISDIDLQSFWGTRSGCRIARVEQKSSAYNSARESIFKEGNLKKIRREKNNLQMWTKILPGHVPRVISYSEKKKTASMLVEFLAGNTMDEIILTKDAQTLRAALDALKKSLTTAWNKTRKKEKIKTDYVRQIEKRLDQIHRVYPDFHREERFLGNSKVASSKELIEKCLAIETQIAAPHSVLIHGDFNSNNIVYNKLNDSLHYIDLYRSKQFDFVQDASVFMISNFRLPVFEQKLRKRLNIVTEEFYEFTLGIAEEWGDKTLQARMALALARSFYTSTRFELNFGFAKDMFMRAHFLMEKLLQFADTGEPWEKFKLPGYVLYY